jgi:Holliday junction resolvasome RuvABC DNA-binding subunit
MTCKVPICVRKEYIIYVHKQEGYIFIHNDVFKWSASVKKKLIEDWEKVVSLFDCSLLVYCQEDNYKLYKFSQMFGFKDMCDVDGGTILIHKKKKEE